MRLKPSIDIIMVLLMDQGDGHYARVLDTHEPERRKLHRHRYRIAGGLRREPSVSALMIAAVTPWITYLVVNMIGAVLMLMRR